MDIKDFFERIYVLHLPERTDRFEALQRELRHLDIDLKSAKVRIPVVPRPSDANLFSSRGTYHNFLTHLAIFRETIEDKLANVWVLEDDAIFSRRMVNEQAALVDTLQHQSWDMCFFGHSLKNELKGFDEGLVPIPNHFSFIWSHCYAVNARILPTLVDYAQMTTELAPGDPRGARMSIDGAFNMFRERNPHVLTLVGNPVLSVQKGSPSSIAGSHAYKSWPLIEPMIRLAREARDQLWRLTA